MLTYEVQMDEKGDKCVPTVYSRLTTVFVHMRSETNPVIREDSLPISALPIT